MKKTNLKKLALKKNVVAQLAKGQMNQLGGGDVTSLYTCPCITEYPTHPNCPQYAESLPCLSLQVCI